MTLKIPHFLNFDKLLVAMEVFIDLLENSVSLDEETIEIINANFWDWLD